jgi:hypothetical protein
MSLLARRFLRAGVLVCAVTALPEARRCAGKATPSPAIGRLKGDPIITGAPASGACEVRPGVSVDSNHPLVLTKAQELTEGLTDPAAKMRALYEFVRDRIGEGPYGGMRASDVLQAGNGYCYNKSVLLTALSRATGIPARLAFDRVSIRAWRNPRSGMPRDISFLHGTVEVWLGDAWRRLDATGNAERWKIWVQDDPIEIPLPLAFSAERDVVFASHGRVTVERTGLTFCDWTDEVSRLTAEQSRY